MRSLADSTARLCIRDKSPAGARDAALIALLYGAGLRRSEAVSLDLSDYNRETGELEICGAKGRKDSACGVGHLQAVLEPPAHLAVHEAADLAGGKLKPSQPWVFTASTLAKSGKNCGGSCHLLRAIE